jgi:serine/threonine-protein kinase
VGDVTESPDGASGAAVTGAKCIAAEAPPGHVALSAVAYQLLGDRSSHSFEDLGERQLPDPLGAIRLYALPLSAPAASVPLRELLRQALHPLQLLNLEGMGGMGEIHLARDPMLRRTLAVKVLRSELADSREAKARFLREARVVAGLSHPNVVDIHAVGQLADGVPYFVMDYVDGGSFADRLEADGPLSIPEARRVIGEVASALEAAHARGVVHRDIKASNILFDRESGRARVTDWGIAAMDAGADMSSDTRLTKTGAVVGSPLYMSPEQLTGDDVGPETDLYSLGLLAFELLTGGSPYAAKTPREVVVAHLREDPRRLADVRPGVDPELDVLVARCLAKDPGDRPRAAELARLAPGAGARVEWPPPGLEGLRGRASYTALYTAMPVLFSAGPMLVWVAITRENPLVPGLVDRDFATMLFLMGLVVTAVTLLALVAHMSEQAVHVWRASHLGYRWRTILEVMADRRGDTGFLLVGAREYAILTPRERGRLRWRRVGAAVAIVLAPPLALPAALLLAVATIPEWWVIGLVLGLVGLVVNWLLEEPKKLRRARAALARSRRFHEDAAPLVDSWHEAVEASSIPGLPPARPSLLVPGAALATGLAVALVTLVMGSFMFAGTAQLDQEWQGSMATAVEAWGRVIPLADLRLEPDPSITPGEAGRLLQNLRSREDVAAEWRVERPLQATVVGSRLRSDPRDTAVRANTGSLTQPYLLQFDSLIRVAARGLTEAEVAYLRGFTGDPRFDDFARLARAHQVDRLRHDPVEPGAVEFYRPVSSWLGLRRTADHKIAQAAYLTAVGELDAAETALREVLSVGLLLADGTDLLSLRLGLAPATAALDGLADLYDAMGRRDEAVRIRASRRVADPWEDAALGVGPLEGEAEAPGAREPARAREQTLADYYARAADVTLARGLRWTYLYHLVLWTQCGDPRWVLAGDRDELDPYLEGLRPTLVRYPSEEPLFDALTLHLERIHEGSEEVVEAVFRARGRVVAATVVRWLHRAAVILRNPRLDACAVVAIA